MNYDREITMILRMHERLGTAGFVIAIVALIAALAGTAFAAAGLTGKQKKEVTKIAKKYAGAKGATGSAGPAGAAGPQGPKGDQGPKGEKGEGGPQGEEGPAGPTETTLPPGKTSTGYWSFLRGEGTYPLNRIPASFPLRVAPEPNEYEPSVNLINTSGPPGSPTPTTECPGSVSNPKAAPGEFCLYVRELVNTSVSNLVGFINNTPDRTSGADLVFQASSAAAESFGDGTWAVTAHCPIDPITEEEEEEC